MPATGSARRLLSASFARHRCRAVRLQVAPFSSSTASNTPYQRCAAQSRPISLESAAPRSLAGYRRHREGGIQIYPGKPGARRRITGLIVARATCCPGLLVGVGAGMATRRRRLCGLSWSCFCAGSCGLCPCVSGPGLGGARPFWFAFAFLMCCPPLPATVSAHGNAHVLYVTSGRVYMCVQESPRHQMSRQGFVRALRAASGCNAIPQN